MVACLESQKMEKLKEKNGLVSKVQQPSWARQEPPNQSGMLVQTCTSSTLEGKPAKRTRSSKSLRVKRGVQGQPEYRRLRTQYPQN